MTPREQRIWDGIYAAAYAHLSILGQGTNSINSGNARTIADIGLAEFKLYWVRCGPLPPAAGDTP